MRRPRGPTADSGHRRIGFNQRVAGNQVNRGAVTLAERGGEFSELRGAQEIGGRIDEVAYHPGCGGG